MPILRVQDFGKGIREWMVEHLSLVLGKWTLLAVPGRNHGQPDPWPNFKVDQVYLLSLHLSDSSFLASNSPQLYPGHHSSCSHIRTSLSTINHSH